MSLSFKLIGFDVLEMEFKISWLVVGHITCLEDEVGETEYVIILGVIVYELLYIGRVEPLE